MRLSIQDLWVENHPDMRAAEAAFAEATKWDADPVKYKEKVSKANDTVCQVRERLLGEFQRATTPDRPLTVPAHITNALRR